MHESDTYLDWNARIVYTCIAPPLPSPTPLAPCAGLSPPDTAHHCALSQHCTLTATISDITSQRSLSDQRGFSGIPAPGSSGLPTIMQHTAPHTAIRSNSTSGATDSEPGRGIHPPSCPSCNELSGVFHLISSHAPMLCKRVVSHFFVVRSSFKHCMKELSRSVLGRHCRSASRALPCQIGRAVTSRELTKRAGSGACSRAQFRRSSHTMAAQRTHLWLSESRR
jgi:hypothetical protein